MLGIAGLLALLWYVIAKPKNLSRAYVGAYIATTIFATPLSQFVWQIDGFSRLFQFPYRMLSGSLLFSGYLIAMMIQHVPKTVRFLLILGLVILSGWQLKQASEVIIYSDQPEGYYTTNEATTTVANEYMPIWVKEVTTERPTVRMGFQKGRGTINFTTQTTQRIVADVTPVEDSIMQINSIYYPGWGVLVNNIPVKVSYNNPNGLIRFPLSQGSHHIVAEFRETIPRFIADIISVLSFVGFGIYSIRRKLFHHI